MSMDGPYGHVDSTSHSSDSAAPGFKHLHVYIEEEDPIAFGQKITGLLNYLEQARAEIIHISTQVMPDLAPEVAGKGLIILTGQVIFRVHETQLASYRERMGSQLAAN